MQILQVKTVLSPKTLREASCSHGEHSHDQYVVILQFEVLVLGVVLVQGAPILS